MVAGVGRKEVSFVSHDVCALVGGGSHEFVRHTLALSFVSNSTSILFLDLLFHIPIVLNERRLSKELCGEIQKSFIFLASAQFVS